MMLYDPEEDLLSGQAPNLLEPPVPPATAASTEAYYTGTAAPGAPTTADVPEPATPYYGRTGYDVVDQTRSQPKTPEEIADESRRKALEKVQENIALGQDGSQGGGPGGPSVVSRAPAWYNAYKLDSLRKKKKKPGDSEPEEPNIEAWRPPTENKLAKGLAGLLINRSVAGTRAAQDFKNRSPRQRMRDARRMALAEGLGTLVNGFLDRKRDNFNETLDVAKREADMAKAMGAGSGSESSDRATRERAAQNLQSNMFRRQTGERLGYKAAADAEQAKLSHDPEHPNAIRARDNIMDTADGFIRYDQVANMSEADIAQFRTGLLAKAAQDRAAAHKQIADRRAEIVALGKEGRAELREYDKKVAEEEGKRRMYALDANMFWKNGKPVNDAQYAAAKEVVKDLSLLNAGYHKLERIQLELERLDPTGTGVGGTLKGLLGNERAQALMNEGLPIAKDIRDLLRMKKHYGVPQKWEDELFKQLVPDPGTFLTWLRGRGGRMYAELRKQNAENGLQLLHQYGVGVKGIDPLPKPEDINWGFGTRPRAIDLPAELTMRDGKVVEVEAPAAPETSKRPTEAQKRGPITPEIKAEAAQFARTLLPEEREPRPDLHPPLTQAEREAAATETLPSAPDPGREPLTKEQIAENRTWTKDDAIGLRAQDRRLHGPPQEIIDALRTADSEKRSVYVDRDSKTGAVRYGEPGGPGEAAIAVPEEKPVPKRSAPPAAAPRRSAPPDQPEPEEGPTAKPAAKAAPKPKAAPKSAPKPEPKAAPKVVELAPVSVPPPEKPKPSAKPAAATGGGKKAWLLKSPNSGKTMPTPPMSEEAARKFALKKHWEFVGAAN